MIHVADRVTGQFQKMQPRQAVKKPVIIIVAAASRQQHSRAEQGLRHPEKHLPQNSVPLGISRALEKLQVAQHDIFRRDHEFYVADDFGTAQFRHIAPVAVARIEFRIFQDAVSGQFCTVGRMP